MNSVSQEEAVAAIREGKLLLYPTETFYALGGDALNPAAVNGVYEAKRRPYGSALPVIIGHTEQLRLLTNVSAGGGGSLALDLAGAFWPGPLTILFPALSSLPVALSAGTGQVAVRLSSHPVAAALSKMAGRPLVSSSANLNGQPAARSASELEPWLLLAARGGVVLDGPEPAGGLPSTIVETVGGLVKIRRPGAVGIAAIRAAGFSILE